MGLGLCCSVLSACGQNATLSRRYSAVEKSHRQPLKEACEVGHPNGEVFSLTAIGCMWGAARGTASCARE